MLTSSRATRPCSQLSNGVVAMVVGMRVAAMMVAVNKLDANMVKGVKCSGSFVKASHHRWEFWTDGMAGHCTMQGFIIRVYGTGPTWYVSDC